MSRVEIGEVVQDSNGNALSNASCQVNKREGGAATCFSAETGAGTVANPILTDSLGRITGWVENGSYDIVVTPAVGTAFTQQFEAKSGRNPVVTVFPTTGVADGDEVDIVADATNGVVWRFKFRAASASAFKWEFVGGPPMFAEILTSNNTASAAYVDLGTAGADVTAPLQGDYMVHHGATIDMQAAGLGVVSYAVGGTAASDNNACFGGDGATGNTDSSPSRHSRHTGVALNTLFRQKYKVNAGNGDFRNRWIALLPIRCI